MKITPVSDRSWIWENEHEYDVWLDFNGFHCNCLWHIFTLKNCRHIKDVKRYLNELS